MKLKTAGILSVLGVAAAMSQASANPLFDIYAGGTAGLGGATIFADGDHHAASAQAYGAVLGLDIPLFRVELEYDYLKTQDLSLHTGMINGYVKMPVPVIKPYLGVGVGTIFGGDAPNDSDIDSGMAYQGMLGVTLNVPVLPLKIDIEGRTIYLPDIYKNSDIKPDVLQYDARVKVRYTF